MAMTDEGRLQHIVENIRASFDQKNEVRDQALKHSRKLTRYCSVAIRSVHRGERDQAREKLAQARDLVHQLKNSLEPYPDLYHAGYTQDALKEYAEATLVSALVAGEQIPSPEDLGIEQAAYLGGLGEAVGELRRRVLDIIRHDEYEQAEELLEMMDEVYGLLVTIDYPDALTRGLRRITDVVRGVTERTRGDLTTSVQQHQLKRALEGHGERNPGE